MKEKIIYNITFMIMGFSIGTIVTECALEYVAYGEFISCLLIPIGLIFAGSLTILFTHIFDREEQKNQEEEKNNHVKKDTDCR